MIATNGDATIAWEEIGTGAPMLLIHGLGYARWGWEPLLPLLAERYRVISFDNRGIGESSVPPGPYTAALMAGDARAVLDAAGVERAHVVGTSLGGMIAQVLALANPDRIDRLVLICTTPGATCGHPMPAVTVRLLAEAAALPPEVAVRRFVENALGSEPDPGLVERILSHRLAAPQDSAGWAAQAAAGTTYDGAGRAAFITVPTLLIAGTADRVVDYRNSVVLAELIPNSVLRLVPDSGHLVFWERPRTVAGLIVEHCT
ncbi:MAG: 3-oxoadipate enol-lactone hydrolase [Anaerolinea sp.]|nr:3-oxoadipate enol-lactone hydrolase [Anaerolinea sp.]